ncbi:ADP-ribose pyrophosphatase [Candidatus Magnetomoraceae bacterium gMMP-15]
MYKNPFPTVDIIIEIEDSKKKDGIILIERLNPPHGWALPGGFVDYGESLEEAAVREALEETCLKINLREQFHTYSKPDRDPRHHTITTVFIAKAKGQPMAADDAKKIGIFNKLQLPDLIVFDHSKILMDYFRYKKGEPLQKIFFQDIKT